MFDDADIEVIVYNGIHKDRGQNTQWFCNERDSNIDGGPFKQGKQNAFGRPPYQKTFLTCPWISNEMVESIGKEDGKVYGRFQDNALGGYARIQSLMNLLGCRYQNDYKSEMMPGAPWGIDGSICKNPFATMRIIVNSVKQLVDCTGNPIVREKAEPLAFMSDMERRPDLTFQNTGGIKNIMKAACEAAFDNGCVPEGLSNMCKDLFRYNDDGVDFPIDWTGTRTDRC